MIPGIWESDGLGGNTQAQREEDGMRNSVLKTGGVGSGWDGFVWVGGFWQDGLTSFYETG
jgi:hypothetical protein